jgi:hypothetical protein
MNEALIVDGQALLHAYDALDQQAEEHRQPWTSHDHADDEPDDDAQAHPYQR